MNLQPQQSSPVMRSQPGGRGATGAEQSYYPFVIPYEGEAGAEQSLWMFYLPYEGEAGAEQSLALFYLPYDG